MHRWLGTTVVLLVLGCGVWAGPRALQQTEDQSGDEVRIRALWHEASVAVCTGNWAAYEHVWAHEPDIALIHPDAPEWLVGWESIGPRYRELLNSGFRCRATTREMRLRIAPSRDMAWATVSVEMSIGSQDPVTSWQTVVFERSSKEWRLVHGHASIPKSAR